MINPKDAATVLRIAQSVGRLCGHSDYLNEFVRRLAAAPTLDIPENLCSLDELAYTLEQLVGCVEPLTCSVRKLDDVLPRPS